MSEGLGGFQLYDFLPPRPSEKEVISFLGEDNLEIYNKAIGIGRAEFVSPISEALLNLLDSDINSQKMNTFCKKSYLHMLYSYNKYHLAYKQLGHIENKLPNQFQVLGCALFFPENIRQSLGSSARRRFLNAFIVISEAEGVKGNISYYQRVLNYVENSKKDIRKEIRGWLNDKDELNAREFQSQNLLTSYVELRTEFYNLIGFEKYKSSLKVELDKSPTGTTRRVAEYSKWAKISSLGGCWVDEWETIFNDIIENVPPPK